MTTIAYRDGILAADTQLSRGDEKAYGIQKILRTEKFLVGIAGRCANYPAMIAFIREHEDTVECAADLHKFWDGAPSYGDYTMLLIDRSHRIWHAVNAPPIYIPATFDSIGSGGAYATGAMLFGASAAEAVRVARMVDMSTGGAVLTVRF